MRLKIRLMDCISQFLATEVVDDFYSSAVKAKTQAHKSVSVRLPASTPSIHLSVCLFIHLSDAMCVEGGIVNVGYSEVVCLSVHPSV